MPFISHEENMFIFKLFPCIVPFLLGIFRLGEDETIENHITSF